MTSWSASIKIWVYRMHYLQKYVPLVKQNVMKLEVFILGGQRRKKGWWRGRRERTEKGSRERIEIEKRQNGTELTI